jgi:DNA-binding NtrC family response regulator
MLLLSDLVGQSRAIPLTRELVLGRGTDCDLSLDEGASRLHARLSPNDGAVTVTDLGSRNGTFVNGRRVQSERAGPGSILRFGDTIARILSLTEEWHPPTTEGPLVGGASLAGTRRLIALVGPTALPVLILGETGTGKEVAARLLHLASGRPGPFVAVNCAALPESLVESELFGHVRGAFTGADRGRKGLFSAASEGTLFLDEVGDIPVAAQAKLLRVIEDGLVRPVGTEAAQKVDVRIVSATNRDLRRAVAEERFRSDLLARLAQVELAMPPLRARPEDIPALAVHLLGRAHRKAELTPNALEALALYDWPQNIRELDTALRRALLAGDGAITFERLPEQIQAVLLRARGEARPASPAPDPRPLKDRVIEALETHEGNVRRASQALGIARSQLYRLLARFEISPERFRR